MAGTTLKPPFPYFGGKAILAPDLAALLPRHDHYVEPFAGSLAVLLAKPPSVAETANDLDGNIATFWRVLRDRPKELARAAMLTPHARAEHELAQDLDVADDLERARRVWVRLTQGRTNSMREKPGWRIRQDVARSGSVPGTLARYADRMEQVAQRLQRVTLECRDAVDVIRDYGRYESVCIYADPPYLGSTREGAYGVEMLGDDQHQALADALNGCKASVVLSGYASPLYEELFPGWHRMEMKAPPALSGDGGRIEVLWSNRPIGEPDLFSLN